MAITDNLWTWAARLIEEGYSVPDAMRRVASLSNRDFLIEVAKGNIAGHLIVNKFGSVTSGSSHTTWKVVSSSATYQTPVAAAALELVSTDNINDIHPDNTSGRTGAHLVRVYGLKLPTSTAEEFEDVKLNGTTAVALASSWWRVYRLKVIEGGTYAALGSPSHDSTLTLQGSGVVWGVINTSGSLGFAQSEIAAFTVPVGNKAYLITYDIEVSNTNGNIDIAIFTRENADDIVAPFTGVMQIKSLYRNIPAGGGAKEDMSAPYLTVVGPADIGFLSKSNGNQVYDCDADFQLLCVSN